MNQKRFLLILLIIVGALALNACVPTTTGGNASSAIVPTATSEVVSTIAAPSAASGQEAAVVEESTEEQLVEGDNHAEQLVEGDNQAEVFQASEIIDLDETWNQYTNYRLGFTIRFPKEMAAMLGSCYWNEEQESYRPEMAFLPVGIFEDADTVYIAPQHYFETAGERADGGKHYYDECNQITNSLELLRDEREMSMLQFWKLVAQDVRDEGELESFLKARYGSGCSLGEQVASAQEGVFDVSILGDGKDLGVSQCPMNYGYKVKYFPSGGRVIAWNTGQAYSFLSAVDWSAGYDREMIESFQFLTGTSVETAEVPLATVGYSSDETGISFNYPTGWAIEEEANAFIFQKGTVRLRVGYRMPGQSFNPGRTGMGGTGVNALEGTAQFLGQSLARYGVYYDDLLIIVVYGGEPGAIVQSGAMEFTIVLDDPDTDYQTLTLTEEILAEAGMILASFEIGSSQGGPIAGLNTYVNDEYGFALNYPSTWTAAEVNDEEFVGPGSRSVQFSQGTVTLVIGYRRAGESVAISGSGAPGGEFEVRGTVHIAGQEVDRYVIVYEGKDKVVMYGEPGMGPIAAGGLEFHARMDDFQPDYDAAELSQAIQDEADMIVSSLALIEAESGTSDDSAEYDTTGWQTYTNEAVGYSLMIPADAQIMAQDPSWRVGFIGPEVDGKPQFQIMIEHYVPNYPEGTDFRESLLEGFRAYLDSLGIDHEGRIEELTIAGESAILTRHPGTSAADQPRDDYFFMHGDMLFTISITLFGGVEDSALNDQFLNSITFAP